MNIVIVCIVIRNHHKITIVKNVFLDEFDNDNFI